MKVFTVVCLLIGLVSATAIPPEVHEMDSFAVSEEQSTPVDLESRTRNELEQGGTCPPVIFIFARGSKEAGNLGPLGPPIGAALKSHYGASDVWVQGVGGPYTASLHDNFLRKGTSEVAIDEMKRLLALANSRCPNAKIVSGGFSQGAALAAAAISDSSSAIRDQIVGTVLFGYTKNQQNCGRIPNYPADRTKIFCAEGDMVCKGSLYVTAAHHSYKPQAASEAPDFLISKIGGDV